MIVTGCTGCHLKKEEELRGVEVGRNVLYFWLVSLGPWVRTHNALWLIRPCICSYLLVACCAVGTDAKEGS